jgi:hypothetical protein
MSIIVNLSGIKQVENALKNLDTFLIKELSNEINASALKIQKDAKRAAPVDNGFLRNNIALTKEEINDSIPKLLEDKDILSKLEEGTSSTSTNKVIKPIEQLEQFINLKTDDEYDYDSEDEYENYENIYENVSTIEMFLYLVCLQIQSQVLECFEQNRHHPRCEKL